VLLKNDVCAFKEQYPGASQQNIFKHFSLLCGKPVLADILCEKEMGKRGM
jgi:hypothetical protein